MRILLVEDDALLGDGVRAGLTQAGYAVDWVTDGLQAQLALKTETYALMVLDLGLPKLSGLEVLQGLRRRNDPLPVLILTARDTVTDRIRGLDAGADDYLVKPFDLDELLARIRALVRRSFGRAAPVLRHKDIALDPTAHTVTQRGLPVELSGQELKILTLLLENAGRVLSRAQLEQSLYGWDDEGLESNAIEVHIHHLRRKLGPDLIRTFRGIGYGVEKGGTDG